MATTMSIDDAVPQTFEKTKVQMCNCGSFTMAKVSQRDFENDRYKDIGYNRGVECMELSGRRRR